MSEPKFMPKTVYVIYIASTPEKVWAALTSAEFTRQYFFGRTVEIEPKLGGNFLLRMPDGRVDIEGPRDSMGAAAPAVGHLGVSSGSKSSANCRNRW